MKFLTFILITISTLVTFAEVAQLPTTKVNAEVIGGDILLIKMKDYVVIKGHESEALVQELGPEGKKNFTRDMVMTKSPEELIATYDPTGAHLMVQTIISRYVEVLARIDSKPRLN